jgi:hypothetical protein
LRQRSALDKFPSRGFKGNSGSRPGLPSQLYAVCPASKTTGPRSGKVMQGLQAASQETCLSWSPFDEPGCADRAEFPSGDGVARILRAAWRHHDGRKP